VVEATASIVSPPLRFSKGGPSRGCGGERKRFVYKRSWSAKSRWLGDTGRLHCHQIRVGSESPEASVPLPKNLTFSGCRGRRPAPPTQRWVLEFTSVDGYKHCKNLYEFGICIFLQCIEQPAWRSGHKTQDRGWKIQGSNPGTCKRFFCTPKRPSSVLFKWYWGSSLELKRLGCGNRQPQLVPRLINNECSYESVHPVCLHGADRGTFTFTFTFTFSYNTYGKEKLLILRVMNM